jgi:hypothetical protein
MFPTASNLFRPRRGVHQLPGEMEPLFPLLLVLLSHYLASPISDGYVVVLAEVLAGVTSTRCRSHRRAVGWNHHDDLRIFIDPGVASRPRAISLRQRPLLGEHRLSSTSSLHPQSL